MQVTLTFDISQHLTEPELAALMGDAEAKRVSVDTRIAQIVREELAKDAGTTEPNPKGARK